MDVNRKPTLSNYDDDGKDTVGITKNLSNKTIAVNGHFRLIGTFLWRRLQRERREILQTDVKCRTCSTTINYLSF